MPDEPASSFSKKAAAGGATGLSAAAVVFMFATFVTKDTRKEDLQRIDRTEAWAFESVPMSNHVSLENQVRYLHDIAISNCMEIQHLKEKRSP